MATEVTGHNTQIVQYNELLVENDNTNNIKPNLLYSYGSDWTKYYTAEPLDFYGDEKQVNLFFLFFFGFLSVLGDHATKP